MERFLSSRCAHRRQVIEQLRHCRENGVSEFCHAQSIAALRCMSDRIRSTRAIHPIRILSEVLVTFNPDLGFNPCVSAVHPPTIGGLIMHGVHQPLSSHLSCPRVHNAMMSIHNEAAELELVEEIVELSRNKLGSEHPKTLQALRDHAGMLSRLGRHEEALPLQKEVLDISKRRFGPEDPESINALNDYADTLLVLGRGHEAKTQKQNVLSLARKREGPGSDHAATITALDNLVSVCKKLGSESEARFFDNILIDMRLRKLTRECEAEIPKKHMLEFTKKYRGLDHPDTIEALDSYASTLSKFGQHADAAPLRKELLRIKREAHGDKHKDALDALRDYADSLSEMLREEAIPLRKEDFELNRQLYGANHSLTHKAMCRYGATLRKLGRPSQAEPLQKEVYENRYQFRGPDHPDTLRALHNYADTLFENDRWRKAEPLKKLWLDLTRNQFGPEHPSTLSALDSYASMLFKIGNETEAEPLKKKVLDVSRRINGPDHPETLQALDSYSEILLGLGRKEEAKSTKKEVFDAISEKSGPEHPKTVKAMAEYALLCRKIGDLNEALKLKKSVMDLNRRRLGSEHPETNRAVNNYAVTLFDLGRASEAEPLLKQVYELTNRNLGLKHPGTLRALDNYAAVLQNMSREDEAGWFKDYQLYQGSDKKIFIAMFDFDQTLAKEHVFHTLAQWTTSAERNAEQDMTGEPVAVSPVGQLSRLTKESNKYNATWAFGGEERIEALRDMLQSLEDAGVKMVVCTLGFPVAAKKLLQDANLLKFFGWANVPSVIGGAAANYDGRFTYYDLQAMKEFGSQVEEHPDEILKGSKAALLDNLLSEEGARLQKKLPLSAAVLVEDDPSAVNAAKRLKRNEAYERIVKKGRLHTVEVVNRKGMRPEVEMRQLLDLVNA